MSFNLQIQKLARLLVKYSLDVKKKESVIIDAEVESKELVLALYREILLAGGHPIVDLDFSETEKMFFKHSKEHQIKKFPKYAYYTTKKARKYIFIETCDNDSLGNVPHSKIGEREKVMQPINNYIYNSRKRICSCIVDFPSEFHAKEAGMSLKAYQNFFFSVCLQDWRKLSKEAQKILEIFKKGKKVHLIGENVDLKLKIRGKKAEADLGKENMPGGEIYMAPKKKSLNGWIKFDYPAIESGREIVGIFLRFKKGKIIEVKAEKNLAFFKKILKTDKNAGYVGEFGIGINSKINKFTKNLLFDEKLGGTIHLALGAAYNENGGGNDSAIHLDIIKNMKKGKIILDGEVVQENGKWKFKDNTS